MTTPEPGLREQILVAAKSLFIQQGYHGLAMREISDAVGVSKAALYYHFKDKEELFLAILSSNLDEIENAIDEIQSKPVSCSEQIVLFVEYVLKQPAEQRAMIRLASQEMSQLSATARKKFDKTYHDQFIGKLQASSRLASRTANSARLIPPSPPGLYWESCIHIFIPPTLEPRLSALRSSTRSSAST